MGSSLRRSATIGRSALAFALLLLGLLGLLGGAPAATAQDPTETNATLRAVHAAPGAPDIDVLLDGQPLAEGIVFGGTTEFAPVPPGDHQIQVVPAGQPVDAAVVDEEFTAEENRAYLFVVLGTLDALESRTFEVDIRGVEEGNARARVIHAVPDAGAVDVAETGGDTIFEGVEFGDASDYVDLAPGSYGLDVRGEDDQTLLQVPELEIQAGRAYDIVALGQVATEVQLLPLVTDVSPPCTEVLGLGDAEDVDQSCLRIVHASPDAPTLDVYLNDSPLAEGLAFGDGTEYVTVPDGEGQQLRIVSAGGSADEPVVETDLDLDGRYAYQVVATGMFAELEASVETVDLSPMPENQSRIRLVHAAPDIEEVDVAIAEGPTAFEGIGFRSSSGYLVIDAGTYTLEVRPGGEETIALRTDVTLEPGMVYDAIAVGRADDQSLALLVFSSPAGVREGAVATPGVTPEAAAGAALAPTVASTEATPAAESTVVLLPTATPTP